MVPGIHRPAVVKVNLGAVKRNTKSKMQRPGPGQKMLAVVKANDYNHGIVKVAKVADQIGVAESCVTVLDEALELGRANTTKMILVLGVTPPGYAPIAVANDIPLTVSNLEWLKEAEKYLENSDLQLKIHLGIDSGIGRVGFNEDKDSIAASKLLENSDNFYVEGMFVHFASADNGDETCFKHQCEKFNHMKSLLTVKPKWIHVDSAAANIFHNGVESDLVKFGIGVYGLNLSSNPNSPDLRSKIALDPALSFEGELAHVKTTHQGDGVGYGSTFVIDKDMIIGTVPISYVDDFIRKLQGFKVKVGNAYCPITGRICMDQFMVEMPKEMPLGTKVIVISDNPDDLNNIKIATGYVDTIHCEVACLLSDRLPRVYYED